MNERLYYSYNGNIATWTQVNALKSYVAVGITYGQEEWIAKLTFNGTKNIFFSKSTDGMTWSPATDSTFTSLNDYSIGYCSTKDVFVSVFDEGIGSSLDGINWKITQSNFDETLHSLQCIENRCVGASNSDVFSTYSCDNGWTEVKLNSLISITNSFPVVGIFTANGRTNNSFIIGGNDGLIYANPTSNIWVQTGTNPNDSNQFFHCYELIFSGSEFVVGCEGAVLKSTNGINWDRDPYTLEGSKDNQVSLITANQLGLLAAEGENDIVYLSNNNGASWNFNIEFQLHEDDDFDIYNIKSVPGRWVVLSSDTWKINNSSQLTPYYEHESNDLVYNPFVAVSDEYQAEKWQVFGSNVWINDLFYLQGRNIYMGVGKGGVFTSSNFYQWTRVSEVNGDCFIAAYDNSKYILTLCNNIVGGRTDQIVKVSSDNGLTFTNFNNPCAVSSRIPNTPLQCKYLQYLSSIKSFAIFTDQIVGAIYLSNTGASSWQLLNFPFAMGIWNLVDNKDNILTLLTDEVLLSGEVSSITYNGPPINSVVYTQSTAAPPLAVFPVVGPVASFDTSDVEIDDGDDSLSGGAIAGIVIGSVFGSLVLVVVVIVIALGGIFLYKKMNKNPEDTALLLYEEL